MIGFLIGFALGAAAHIFVVKLVAARRAERPAKPKLDERKLADLKDAGLLH
jgi:hypothetical protein